MNYTGGTLDQLKAAGRVPGYPAVNESLTDQSSLRTLAAMARTHLVEIRRRLARLRHTITGDDGDAEETKNGSDGSSLLGNLQMSSECFESINVCVDAIEDATYAMTLKAATVGLKSAAADGNSIEAIVDRLQERATALKGRLSALTEALLSDEPIGAKVGQAAHGEALTHYSLRTKLNDLNSELRLCQANLDTIEEGVGINAEIDQSSIEKRVMENARR